MSSKNKKINKSKLMTSPWNQENGYVIDYTFATRLFSFLLRMYQSMSSTHPIEEEEFEYLIRSAAKLKKWQMQVPSKLNNQYFNNLKNLKIKSEELKYLNAIGCPNVIDVEKYLNNNVDDKNKSDSFYNGIWVAAGTDGKYRAFIGKPIRNKEKEMVEDLDTEEEDYHGHFYHPNKWTGNWLNYWDSMSSIRAVERGTIIDPNDLPASFQNMTWEDEPRLLLV